VTVPFRHLFIPGDANWTEQGHRFAWHMMLRNKSGEVTFLVDDGERDRRRSTRPPQRSAGPGPAGTPRAAGAVRPPPLRTPRWGAVRAETSVSLNGRPRVPIVDPELDLASVQVPWWGDAGWILENPEPLPQHR
jgi:vitamin K-dependent gamma-carboxylase